jgi:uncharacterized protein
MNGINLIKDKFKIENDKIVIIGNSKGAEATLLISQYINAHAIIACVPSCYVWQGLPKGIMDIITPKSSWTINEKELPFIRMKFNLGIIKDIKNKIYRTCYEKSINDNRTKNVSISLSQYTGKLLLLSSDLDTYWPSTEMCENLIENNNRDITHKVLHIDGHYFQEINESISETINFLESLKI